MRGIAVLVHMFTASGMIALMLAFEAIWYGDARLALLWLGAAMVIDGLDGPMARHFKVSERLPHIDGAILDHVIDYTGYVFLPAVMIYRFGLVPVGLELPVACMVAYASLYVFANRDLKTAENDFRGFPALWNIVIFYFVVFETSQQINLLVCVVLSAMVFAPIVVLHPLRVVALRRLTVAVGALWLAMATGYLLMLPALGSVWADVIFALASLYFFALCGWRSWHRLSAARNGET